VSWRRRSRSNSSRNSCSVGSASEITDRISGYVDNGLEHAILGDVTGVVGGLDEINANAGQLQSLLAALRKLTPVGCD
jgi:phthiodiolone/phenolphthiodiolone dimycocerosates ketoreductase